MADEEAGRPGAVREGDLLWEPGADRVAAARLTHFLDWLRRERGVGHAGYPSLWRWSVDDLSGFWAAVWDYFGLGARPDVVLAERTMPGARWFPGATLNYAEQALSRTGAEDAVVGVTESGGRRSLSWDELRAAVGAAAAGLRRLGVRRGDRVVAVAPHAPETVVAFLATASLGAVWASCSPDFGARSLGERFAQLEPTVLVTTTGYTYAGRDHDISATVAGLVAALPSLRAVVVLPGAPVGTAPDAAVPWSDLVAQPAEPVFEAVPFDHPLWMLFSSGTTGLPKPIVQGHGGIVLEHLKALALHSDLGPGDRFFWFTTTGWMMWNFVVSGLLVGATVVCYDGSPGHPDLGTLWRLAERERVTLFGTSAPFIAACMKAGLRPREIADLSTVEAIGSTGAPLTPEGFAWLAREVSATAQPASVSGGTDLCTAFVTCVPTLPVHVGEIQAPALGAAVAVYDLDGKPVVGEVGELVLLEPMPSMPLSFWGDTDGTRLREAYFADFPGVWRHGDWARLTEHGGIVIYGRSDSTLNRGGVRLGTSEFYRVVEELPEVVDSLVIDTSALAVAQSGGAGELLLFVVLADGARLDDALLDRMRAVIRSQLSPRHVPDRIVAVDAIPRTLNGKKLEVPVKRILAGMPVDRAVSVGAVADPRTLDPFIALRDTAP